ncbi:MAG TPA: hypothetical protein PKD24_10560 [Pyrinomonadaceae bacterium]|nr:hypothetical protein [Pyrinomonadaceae bacterium]HMP65367.1 hypothetical protein [Pyrinomonadaceae bacterium]
MECSEFPTNVGTRIIGFLFFLTLTSLLLSVVASAKVSEESRTNVLGYHYWNFTATNEDKVDFCNLFESRKYDSKQILTTAILYIPPAGEPRVDGGDDRFFYAIECNNMDYFAIADFSRTKNLDPIRNSFDRESISSRLFQVKFTGRFQVSLFPWAGHLGWLRADFKVTEILSAVVLGNEANLPDLSSEPPIMNKGSHLRDLNNHLLFSYFSKDRRNAEIDRLLAKTSEIIIDGKRVEPAEFAFRDQVGKIGIRTKDISEDEEIWRLQGTITNEVEDRGLIQLEFEGEYVWQSPDKLELRSLLIRTIGRGAGCGHSKNMTGWAG